MCLYHLIALLFGVNMLVVSLCDLTSLMALWCCRTVEPTHFVLVLQLSDAFEKMVLHLSSPTRHINFYDFFTMKMSSWKSGTYMSLVSHYYRPLNAIDQGWFLVKTRSFSVRPGLRCWCFLLVKLSLICLQQMYVESIYAEDNQHHIWTLWKPRNFWRLQRFFVKGMLVEKHIWTQWFVSYSILVESWQLHHPRWIEAL